MLTFTDLDVLLLVVVLITVVLIGAVITLGNERQRAAILRQRDAIRDSALADLSARRAQMARNTVCHDGPQALATLNQIAYDAAGRHLDLTQLNEVTDEQTLAILATGADGCPVVFTPSAREYLRTPAVRAKRLRRWQVKTYPISPLRSDAFVVEELNAIAKYLSRHRGVPVMLPRVAEWDMIILPPPPAPIAARSSRPAPARAAQ